MAPEGTRTPPPLTGTEALLIAEMPLIATVPLMALFAGSRAELLRDGQNIEPQLV